MKIGKTLLAVALCAPLLVNAAVDISVQSHFADKTVNSVVLGLMTEPSETGFYGQLEYGRVGGGGDAVEIQAGFRPNFYRSDKVYVSGKVGIGYAAVDVKGAPNNYNFFTLPVGVEAGYRMSEGSSVYAGLGYKFAFDKTSKTTCRDGSTSNSSGRGTCSHHGGIGRYNDKLGKQHGATVSVGFRF